MESREKKVSEAYQLAESNPLKYWENTGREIVWRKPFTSVLDSSNPPFYKWFSDGALNICDSIFLENRKNEKAVIWQGEPENEASITWSYKELEGQVLRWVEIFSKFGLKPGDGVTLYMPLLPEAVSGMLACARQGLIHNVVFGGFSSEALKDRMIDSNAKILITADFGYRRGKTLPLIEQARTAASQCSSLLQTVVVLRDKRTSTKLLQNEQPFERRFVTVEELNLANRYPAETLNAEHPLFVLYTSGTTGKPKGLLHTQAGYLACVKKSFEWIFDPKPNDVYWCTADVGWVTGHSYLVYGPLSSGSTVFMYEGAPTEPTPDRFWKMIEEFRVTQFYTAPTAIRALMKLGDEYPGRYKMNSLRILGSVGEPINPEAWRWYSRMVGHDRCPIVDTYWQTETGSIVLSSIPGYHPTKPGYAGFALPGFKMRIGGSQDEPNQPGVQGRMLIEQPWPSMARTICGDPERFKQTYFNFKNQYITGDAGIQDSDGYFMCLGRLDDVLNVSGHRIGTMEIESALVGCQEVAEAAVVGRPDAIKGQGIVAFVILKDAFKAAQSEALNSKLKQSVAAAIGGLARPDEIRFTKALPKTRSGKIMRRLLRDLVTNPDIIQSGFKTDLSTLEDISVLSALSDEE